MRGFKPPFLSTVV